MIILKDITKVYEVNKQESVMALKRINLHIKKGELVVLKGVSGSGKSTILSLIASLSKPTTGEVIVDNKRVSKLPDDFASAYRQETIGFIFQKYNLIATLSVLPTNLKGFAVYALWSKSAIPTLSSSFR